TAPDTRGAQPAPLSDVERLRSEVDELRAEIARLRSLVETAVKSQPIGAATTPQTVSSVASNSQQGKPASDQAAKQDTAKGQSKGAPQSTAAPENSRLALTSKAQGGDLSGAGNLLRTDRITIGGYGDFQFRQSSINERADGGGTPTFQNTRMVL